MAASAALGSALAHLTPRVESRGARAALAWAEACGDPLARFTEPLGFEDGLLLVGVRGRDRREVLFAERHLLTARLRERVPGLRGFRLVDLPPAPPPPPPEPPRVRAARAETAEIADPALRAAFDALLDARQRAAEARTEAAEAGTAAASPKAHR